MKVKRLFIVFLTLCSFYSCHKEEKLFSTHIKGKLVDCFNGNELEGVTVALVYTYGFYHWSSSYATITNVAPSVIPDTLEKTTTDSKGEFNFKFHVKKSMDRNSWDQSIFGYSYGYLLVFYKDGTEYFKQYYSLGDCQQKKYEVEVKLRPLLEFQFKVHTQTKPNEKVYFNCTVDPSHYIRANYQPYRNSIVGKNLDTTIVIKSEYFETIDFFYEVGQSPPTGVLYATSENREFTPTAKIIFRDVLY